MLFGLNLGLDSSDGNPGDNIPYRQAPYQHLHHPHQHPDHYRSGSIQSDSNCPNQQLPMDQRLFELPSSISYNEFQLPLNLFGTTSQSISSYLSPNPSSYSSNSSKHSSFNSQYHPLSSIRDPPSQNPSPSPLARAYLSNPFDLIDPLNPSLKLVFPSQANIEIPSTSWHPLLSKYLLELFPFLFNPPPPQRSPFTLNFSVSLRLARGCEFC